MQFLGSRRTGAEVFLVKKAESKLSTNVMG